MTAIIARQTFLYYSTQMIRPCTAEFKDDAIKLVTEQGYSCNEVARRLGVNHSNISRWIREQKQEKQDLAENGISRRQLEAQSGS